MSFLLGSAIPLVARKLTRIADSSLASAPRRRGLVDVGDPDQGGVGPFATSAKLAVPVTDANAVRSLGSSRGACSQADPLTVWPRPGSQRFTRPSAASASHSVPQDTPPRQR